MVELRYLGHLGNNLFSYALARLIAEHLGHALKCTARPTRGAWREVEDASGIQDRLPGWIDAFEDARQELPGRVVEAPSIRWIMWEKLQWTGHGIHLATALDAKDRRLVLEGWFQRVEYVHPHREQVRRWLRPRPRPLPIPQGRFGPRDVVVHVRRSLDVRMLDRTLDVGWYVAALAGLSPAAVYVVGTGVDAALREALAPFGPTYLADLSGRDAFALLAAAPTVVLANSTFSWWAAYVGNAGRVVAPVPERGPWSGDRSDIDLRVPEARYLHSPARLEPFRPFRRTRAALPLGFQEALASWLQARGDAPFGALDLAASGFTTERGSPVRAALVGALRAGALEDVAPAAGAPPLADLLANGAPFGVA